MSTKTKERQTEKYDQQDTTVLGRYLWKAILNHLCHTAQSHSSKQVLERKVQGHELKTVLLTNFLIERFIMTLKDF